MVRAIEIVNTLLGPKKIRGALPSRMGETQGEYAHADIDRVGCAAYMSRLYFQKKLKHSNAILDNPRRRAQLFM